MRFGPVWSGLPRFSARLRLNSPRESFSPLTGKVTVTVTVTLSVRTTRDKPDEGTLIFADETNFLPPATGLKGNK